MKYHEQIVYDLCTASDTKYIVSVGKDVLYINKVDKTKLVSTIKLTKPVPCNNLYRPLNQILASTESLTNTASPYVFVTFSEGYLGVLNVPDASVKYFKMPQTQGHTIYSNIIFLQDQKSKDIKLLMNLMPDNEDKWTRISTKLVLSRRFIESNVAYTSHLYKQLSDECDKYLVEKVMELNRELREIAHKL
jgi:hypothetical protein